MANIFRLTGVLNTLTGTNLDDKIYGRGKQDRLYGLDGDDLLFGTGNHDYRLFGGSGDDRILVAQGPIRGFPETRALTPLTVEAALMIWWKAARERI